VRRSDLYTRSCSSSPTPSEPDPELEAQFRARLTSIYGPLSNSNPASIPVTHNESATVDGDSGASEEAAEQEFEFRLFSSTGPGSRNDEVGTTQKVVLVHEEEDIGDGGFVVRDRNREYYFAEKASGDTQVGFEIMALSGEEVMSRARKRAWGLEVPWRVRVLKVVGRKRPGDAGEVVRIEDGVADMKRKRPGKKRRVILREQKKSKEKLEEQKKLEREKKDEAEKEKRTRRNREKKVKRKMKEKAKKAGDAVDDGDKLGESSLAATGDELPDQ
jgi:hypothetical protein